MEGDLTYGGGHSVQHTNDALQICTPGTYVISLPIFTPMNLTKIKKSKTVQVIFSINSLNKKSI